LDSLLISRAITSCSTRINAPSSSMRSICSRSCFCSKLSCRSRAVSRCSKDAKICYLGSNRLFTCAHLIQLCVCVRHAVVRNSRRIRVWLSSGIEVVELIRVPRHACATRAGLLHRTPRFHAGIAIELGTPVISDHDANRLVINVR
jgi:hypothetical protein